MHYINKDGATISLGSVLVFFGGFLNRQIHVQVGFFKDLKWSNGFNSTSIVFLIFHPLVLRVYLELHIPVPSWNIGFFLFPNRTGFPFLHPSGYAPVEKITWGKPI